MSIIVIPNTFSAGAIIVASQHNSNFTAISSDYNGNIDNSNIASGAAIAYSKLALTGGIVNADISASAAIVGSKLNLTAPGVIGSVTPSTGAFTTLKVGTTHQGDVLYDNNTSIVRLTPGTSGQFLKTNGTSANPSWGDASNSFKFTSTTSFSAAIGGSGNIAITATKYYSVVVNITSPADSEDIIIQFNADSGSHYKYAFDGRTTTGALTGGSSSTTQIDTSTTVLGTAPVTITFNIFPQIGTKVQCHGKTTYTDKAGSLFSYVDFGGYWDNSAAVTSFLIASSGSSAITGVVNLYELQLV